MPQGLAQGLAQGLPPALATTCSVSHAVCMSVTPRACCMTDTLCPRSRCRRPPAAPGRDPRWGRMAETFGEDPLVNANMAIAHVTGLQGGDGSQTYLKTAATCKVRSGSGSAAVQRRLLAVGLDSVGETRRRCKVAAPPPCLPSPGPHLCPLPLPHPQSPPAAHQFVSSRPCSTSSATTWRGGGA